MASKTDVEIKIIGAGSSKFGLWLLGFVARMFRIILEVRPTKRQWIGDGLCEHGKGHCQCDNPRCSNYCD
jgi:hypothetical protein